MTKAEIARIKSNCTWSGISATEIEEVNEKWNEAVAGYKNIENLYKNSKDFRDYVEKDCKTYGYSIYWSLKMAHVKEYAKYLAERM